MTEDEEQTPQACERCGQLAVMEIVDGWLCEDCYWDFQTGPDGDLDLD